MSLEGADEEGLVGSANEVDDVNLSLCCGKLFEDVTDLQGGIYRCPECDRRYDQRLNRVQRLPAYGDNL